MAVNPYKELPIYHNVSRSSFIEVYYFFDKKGCSLKFYRYMKMVSLVMSRVQTSFFSTETDRYLYCVIMLRMIFSIIRNVLDGLFPNYPSERDWIRNESVQSLLF